jgi:hypothetical protein
VSMSLSQSISPEVKGKIVGEELHIFLLTSVSDTFTDTGVSGEADFELEMPSRVESSIEKRVISPSGSHKTANVRPESAGTM